MFYLILHKNNHKLTELIKKNLKEIMQKIIYQTVNLNFYIVIYVNYF